MKKKKSVPFFLTPFLPTIKTDTNKKRVKLNDEPCLPQQENK